MHILFVLQAAPWADLVARIQELGSSAERGGLALAAAALVVLVGWAIAALLSRVARALLRALRFNDGVRGVLGAQITARHEPAAMAGWGIYRLSLAAASLLALDPMEFDVGAAVAGGPPDLRPRIATLGLL